jgi:type I restriction enzyme M protein
MVRLSLVNLYLHGFVTPKVHEYDSLTSEERWNEYADVILANPPFMSPKGGIQPHKRFSVQSNRSEVLFVDYMAEHLTPNGRAAIIVPEGIIFQSAGAYKQLRKYLIEHNYLWAVVSLPAGVFNPYAGVKTSILLLDKALAKKTDQILFVKVEADGFDLGAQRRPIDRNDLPDALNTLHAWRDYVIASHKVAKQSPNDEEVASSGSAPSSQRHGASDLPIPASLEEALSTLEGVASGENHRPRNDMYLLVSTSRLAGNDDYNLSADRYREVTRNGKMSHKLVTIKEVCSKITDGSHYSPPTVDKGYPYITVRDITDGKIDFENCKFITQEEYQKLVKSGSKPNKNDVLFSKDGTVGKVALIDYEKEFVVLSSLAILTPNIEILNPEYLRAILASDRFIQTAIDSKTGIAIRRVVLKTINEFQIPLPPLETQRQIVDEIAAHQRIIDGARQVVEGWKPDVQIELDELLKEAKDEIWKRVPLAEVCEQITDGTHVTPTYTEDGVPFLRVTDITGSNDSKKFISKEEHKQLIKRCKPVKGDVLYSKNGTIGVAKYIDWDWEFSIFVSLAMLKPKRDILDGKYLESFLNSDDAYFQATAHSKSGTVTNLHLVEIKQMEIPLPPLEVQREIVARIERERSIVEGNSELIRIYEEKVKKVIERVWEG